MRVAVTGTPGTGKTTATDRLDTDLSVVHLNELVTEERFAADVDGDRDSLIADIEGLRDHLADEDDVIIESHLAHRLPADRVVVLRCHPEELEARLTERGEQAAERGEDNGSDEPASALARKARENAESEALDVVLSEAVDRHGREVVYEVDTTGRDPGAVAADIEAVIAGERDPSAGEVDFLDYL